MKIYQSLSKLNTYQGNKITNLLHVLILGAGASRAALPNGDKNGKKLPLMNDFVETIGLDDLVSAKGNFEEIYSELCKNNHKNVHIIEKRIYNYFDKLELPDEPNLYDYLILSLRKKDVIATFNWDPFLIQAYSRNQKLTDNLPRLLFLHGNVWEGICKNCGDRGFKKGRCRVCGKRFEPVKILYPIKEKDYNSDLNIRDSWDYLKIFLHKAQYVTIFGYSIPESDIEAKKMLQEAWGDKEKRFMEQIELIDIQEEDILCAKWEKFIHTHHYEYTTSFFESQLFRFPRRSIEAYFAELWEGNWLEREDNPKFDNFPEIHKWFSEIIKTEVYQ